ncbi:hypothetical protein T09_7203 [Trichinella sp. T9]|nr:hypothetical protein T09_7203 [Trichinella sp. T9]
MARQLTKLGKEKITWTWNMARNSEKREKLEMYTVGSRIW